MLVAATLSVHSLLTSHVVLYIVLFALFSGIIVSIFVPPTEFPKSRLYIFFSVMASITVVLIGFSLILSAFSFQEQEKVNRTHFTKEAIDKLWLYPNEVLAKSPLARPEFLMSLYPNNVELFNLQSQKESTSQTVYSIMEEQYIAILMIQAWEDYTTMRQFESTGDEVWLANFLQWAQSPYLKHYFEFLKYNYKATTIELANILFEYAEKMPTPTPDPELYHSLVLEMLKDQRMLDLFKKVSEPIE